MERPDTKETIPISEAKKLKDTETSIVGMIQDKKETNSKNIYLEIEDLTDNIAVLLPHKEKELINKSSKIFKIKLFVLKGPFGKIIHLWQMK